MKKVVLVPAIKRLVVYHKVCRFSCLLSALMRIDTIDTVPVVELKESGFLSCPRRRMINTRDGVMSGLENSRKRGKWTKIFDDKSMKTKSILAKSISRMKKLKYVSIS